MAEDTLGCLSNALPENWWRDPVTLKHEVSVHGGQTEAALAHSCAPATISKWWVRAGFPKQDGGRRADHPVLLSTDDQWLMDALKKAGDNASLHDVADAADVSSKRVREAIDRLAIQGIRISLDENTVRVLRSVPASETTSEAQPGLFNGDIVRFGVVSDTHLGSKECRLTELKTAYSIFEREGIEQVIHPGDLVAGMGIYRHQLRDLAVIGFDAQVEYAVAEYPRVEGIKTLIVGGNHDIEGDFGRQASDPVKAFCSQRDDFEHLGDYSAFLTFPNGAMGHILHPGGGGSYAMCHDSETEILTHHNGWKLFADLAQDDEVATLSADGELEWQVPTEHHSYPYEGEMVQFGGTAKSSYDMLVTPNHRMWVRRPHVRKRFKGWRFVEAQEIKSRSWKIRRGFGWKGSQTQAPLGFDRILLAEFMGWYISEGSCNPANNQVQIAQALTSPYYEEIASLIERMGFSVGRYGGKVSFSNKVLADYLKEFGHSHVKFIPEWIKEGDQSTISSFLDAYWKGDGTFVHGRKWSATTVSGVLADDVQELLFKIGLTSCVQKQEPTTDRVWPQGHTTLAANQRTRYVITATRGRLEPSMEKVPDRVQYSGDVWCVTVPNGIVFTRRNGKPAWSGNSYRAQKIAEAYEGGAKPNFTLFGHWHRRGAFEARSIQLLLCGTFEGSTSLAKRYGLGEPALGFHIVEARMSDDGSLVEWNPRWFPFYRGRVEYKGKSV